MLADTSLVLARSSRGYISYSELLSGLSGQGFRDGVVRSHSAVVSEPSRVGDSLYDYSIIGRHPYREEPLVATRLNYELAEYLGSVLQSLVPMWGRSRPTRFDGFVTAYPRTAGNASEPSWIDEALAEVLAVLGADPIVTMSLMFPEDKIYLGPPPWRIRYLAKNSEFDVLDRVIVGELNAILYHFEYLLCGEDSDG